MADRNDEFYVGYLEQSPAGIPARSRVGILAVFLVGLLLATVLVLAQARFDRGTFEFGVEREFRGVLVERPYPLLLVSSGDSARSRTTLTTHYLVEYGKRGAAERVAGLDGEPVLVTGSLVHNDRARMIEVHAVERLEGDEAQDLRRLEHETELTLGSMTLLGEIVDAKCHLGVMKPGRGKPHRACAVRCISGGIPPVLRVEDRSGNVDYFLLVSSDGKSVNRDVLDFVADPVEITGRATRSGDRLVLYADPSSYRRIGS